MKKSLLAVAVLTATLPSHVLAEQAKHDKMEETIVSAHRVETPLYRVGSSVTVLTEQQLDAKGQSSLADVLRTLPGVAVSTNGGEGKATALRIRGEEDYRTLVLIDGVKVSDVTAPQVSARIEHIGTANIERIELLRGPQGMIYGADAGGVLSITTKRATDGLEGSVGAELGRYNKLNLSANVRGKTGSVDYSIMANDNSTDGFNAMSNDTVLGDDDGYENQTFHANVGIALSETLSARLVLRDVDTKNEYDSSFGTRDRDADYEQQVGRLSFVYETDAMSHSVAFSESQVERQLYADSSASYDYEGKTQQAQYLSTYSLSKASKIIAGIDSEEQTDEARNNEQDQLGVFAEYQGEIVENFSYSAGVRYDDNDAAGEFTTYRATTAYWQDLGSDAVKYKASYGTGFRVPSLYEVAYNVRPGAYAPALGTVLAEETSEGFDMGIEYHTSAGHYAEVVYFYTEIENAIEFDLQTYSGYLQDKGVSRSQGVEFIGEYVLNSMLSLTLNATYNDAENSEGEQRARRPRLVANMGLQGLFADDKLRVNLNVRGSRSSVDSNGDALDNYAVVSLRGSYQVTPEAELYVRGENLLDKQYQEISNYNTSGAAFYIGGRYHFGG